MNRSQHRRAGYFLAGELLPVFRKLLDRGVGVFGDRITESLNFGWPNPRSLCASMGIRFYSSQTSVTLKEAIYTGDAHSEAICELLKRPFTIRICGDDSLAEI